jgi:hypothetical protein
MYEVSYLKVLASSIYLVDEIVNPSGNPILQDKARVEAAMV